MTNYITDDKLTWDNSFLGILDDTYFSDEIHFKQLKQNEFHQNSINVLINGVVESVKISIFIYNIENNIQIILEEFKGMLGLWMMGYHIIQIEDTKYLISKDMSDMYTKEKIKTPLGNGYIEQMQKIILFQWLFCIKSDGMEKTLSRSYPVPSNKPQGLDVSFIVSCFEYDYYHNTGVDFPRSMINRWFFERDEYFISSLQYLLGKFEDINIFIQRIRDVIIENKGDITWFDYINNRIKHILSIQPMYPRLYWASNDVIIP